MRKDLFDYDSGNFVHTISNNMAMDSDGDFLMRMGDNTALDMDSGDLHFFLVGLIAGTMTNCKLFHRALTGIYG